MLTSRNFVAVLIALVILIVVIVQPLLQRRSGKLSHHATTPLPQAAGPTLNLKPGTESDVNKDRRPGGASE